MDELPPLELSDEDLRLLARYGGIKELREVRPPWLVLLLGLGAAVAVLVIVVAFLGLHVALAGGLLEGAGRLAQWAGASTGGKVVLVGSVLAIGVARVLWEHLRAPNPRQLLSTCGVLRCVRPEHRKELVPSGRRRGRLARTAS